MRLLVFCMINSQLFPARHKRLKKKGTYRFRRLIKWQPTRIIVHCGLGAWQIWSSHISVCGLSRDEWIMQWYSWWRSGKLCMTVILATDFFFHNLSDSVVGCSTVLLQLRSHPCGIALFCTVYDRHHSWFPRQAYSIFFWTCSLELEL